MQLESRQRHQKRQSFEGWRFLILYGNVNQKHETRSYFAKFKLDKIVKESAFVATMLQILYMI